MRSSSGWAGIEQRMKPWGHGPTRRRKEEGHGGLYMFSKGSSRLREASISSGAWARLRFAYFPWCRVAALGRPQQLLLVPEADLSATLPCNDRDWDAQITPRMSYSLSSPPESLGRYASVAQSCYLLSCVFCHISDASIPCDSAKANFLNSTRP